MAENKDTTSPDLGGAGPAHQFDGIENRLADLSVAAGLLHHLAASPLQIEPAELDYIADQIAAGIKAIAADRAGPDADLVRQCAEHIANRAAYNADGGRLELESDPLWLAYERTRNAIDNARPQTVAGLLAKARAAKAEARRLDGTEEPEGTVAATWAFDIANDLLRLHGEVTP